MRLSINRFSLLISNTFVSLDCCFLIFSNLVFSLFNILDNDLCNKSNLEWISKACHIGNFYAFWTILRRVSIQVLILDNKLLLIEH